MTIMMTTTAMMMTARMAWNVPFLLMVFPPPVAASFPLSKAYAYLPLLGFDSAACRFSSFSSS